MIAYTKLPTGVGPYEYVAGPNGGSSEYNGSLPFWKAVKEMAGIYRCSADGPEPQPPEVEAVMKGEPPTPEGGWKIGSEIIIRSVCYAGPQWIFTIYRLSPGENPGLSYGPVGRVAYGQRLY